ncbi:hypothetical protein [Mycobacterium sp. Lab-001]|uniref:hypothetical protein n=1 Tax=Mycobacterium sp. Lab-001 TaxID=3410136 RepID=UPI003D17E17D
MTVVPALLIQCARSDDRMARRLDRVSERDDDADLIADNVMLDGFVTRYSPRRTHQPAN